jgi:uncharacterized damage-inducible protein DinB
VILVQQYTLVQRSRAALFDFVDNPVGVGLGIPVTVFGGKSISNLLEHTASCYFNWLGDFALQLPANLLKVEGCGSMPEVRDLYDRVDGVMTAFLKRYGENLEEPIKGVHDACGPTGATTLQLFTHVTTHEFHHKGQILLMCRQLGHVPPDTDVSLAFNYDF